MRGPRTAYFDNFTERIGRDSITIYGFAKDREKWREVDQQKFQRATSLKNLK